jgi:hypothetical protein
MGESGRFWHLGKKNYVRIILLAVALLLTGLAMTRLFGEVQTSYQTQLAEAPTPTATATPASTTPPSATPGSAATATPANTVSPSVSPVPSTAATETTTSTKGTGSDTLILGLLALAAFFALIAVYYGRIASITFPGGAVIALNTTDASSAVASKIRSSAEAAARSGEDSTDGPAAHLAGLAAAPNRRGGADDVLNATEKAAQQAGQATISTIQKAQALLRLAERDPYAFQALASEWKIPSAESVPVLAGHITSDLWSRLAERSLAETDPARRPSIAEVTGV